jgi:hypothetical protein
MRGPHACGVGELITVIESMHRFAKYVAPKVGDVVFAT